ncbi:MAG: hypothetical protein C4325_07260 [Blastocatellia bacterium]
MHLGVVFPQTEIGTDPGAIRDYAQAVEEAGYHHLLVYDHVLGAVPERFAGSTLPFRPPYTHESPFHEPMVLFGYLAALTRRLELVTGVLILPQRQTALVAKQAAEVDVLTGGRLRLGVGIGWNFTEYEALNEDFHTRGRRIAEQIAVLAGHAASRAFQTVGDAVIWVQATWGVAYGYQGMHALLRRSGARIRASRRDAASLPSDETRRDRSLRSG